MLQYLKTVTKEINIASSYSKDKSNKFGEVFTPFDLINEITSKLPKEIWKDPSKTFFDPCAGKGNFSIILIIRLFSGLKNTILDEEERLKHIVEKQIYMAEFQRESAEFIAETFKFERNFKVNLYHGDTLKMPENFFDLSWEERFVKYPDNCITSTSIIMPPKEILAPKEVFIPNIKAGDFKSSRDLSTLFS